MMGQNLCFEGVIGKIIPVLSSLPLYMWSTVQVTNKSKVDIKAHLI